MAKTQKKAAVEKIELTVTPRTELGKKVKQLRRQGIIPANIFGEKFESQAISVASKDFTTAYKVAKETGIIYMTVDGKAIPTLVKHIQRHPVTDGILHVDFRKIDLKHKLETTVPVMIVGESEAVKTLGGVLLTLADHLTIESLPADIPAHIEVDITSIKELGQDIKVADLPKSDKYEVKDEPTKVIVSVTAHKEESVTPETTATETEVITEKPAEEGEAAAEEAPAEEKK